jgi:predicted MPP superfamily phosphohydrolase
MRRTYAERVRLRLLPLLALGWPFVEPHRPVLRRAHVPVLPSGAHPLRILHLSDLHLLARSRRRAAWVRGLASTQPDLVVSTGDHLSSPTAIGLLASTLGALTADGTPGVFVAGNNDYYTPGWPSPARYLTGRARLPRRPDLPWGQAAAALADVGWTDLTGRRTRLTLAGQRVVLTGTDDAHLGRDRYARVAGRLDPASIGIGVTHTPARRLLHAFADDGHALVLAGHTHGGQVRLPVVGAVVTNCDLERRQPAGASPLVPQGAGWLHVSAGLGTSPYAPARLGCRPEATLLELAPRARSAAGAVR